MQTYLTILAHDIFVPAGMVDVLTLRVDVPGNGGFVAASPHGSTSLIDSVAGEVSATGAALVSSAGVLQEGVAPHPSDVVEAAEAADAAVTLEAVILAQEGASSTTVLSAFSETAGHASSVSVFIGRVFLSPPFWARGAPLVDPPRPPRKPSMGDRNQERR